jgi:hypothetical protein
VPSSQISPAHRTIARLGVPALLHCGRPLILPPLGQIVRTVDWGPTGRRAYLSSPVRACVCVWSCACVRQVCDDWLGLLPPGQRQLLGCARLCYHSPALGLLDESTSSMSVEAEARVYRPRVIIATSRTLG